MIRNLGDILLYSILGLATGVATNRFNRWLDAEAPVVYDRKWAAILLKLLVVGLFLAAVQATFKQFAGAWQATTPGLFFVTFFFGLQTSLMEDVTSFA